MSTRKQKIKDYHNLYRFLKIDNRNYIPIICRRPFMHKAAIIDADPPESVKPSGVKIFLKHGIRLQRYSQFAGDAYKCSLVILFYKGKESEFNNAMIELENSMALTNSEAFRYYQEEKEEIFNYLIDEMRENAMNVL